ncbi:hypothetical protein PSV09DRAFT_2417367 [Bipolaris maydis]|nr:hypothetical protein J3E74DRAFT_433665 [Bipolaris maydis]KAJ5057381.1 hypothetical protein J3E74DRAFT_439670 [Bipolaris maydis]KAJ6212876.1 hypothetical protein PSV09DRAFT_2417367 [Bipolaris maydis]
MGSSSASLASEPIGLTSGVLTLVIFAHKSCLTLYETIQSFKTHPKRVRNLINELEALISVLESLDETIKLHTDAKLKYIGDDINNFTDTLAAYKLTINIALTDMQLRKSSITLERLRDYKDLITTATNDLKARLKTINEKLQSLVERTTSSSATPELQSLKEEPKDLPQGVDSIPKKITSDGIQEYRISIEQTTAKLETHIQNILDQIMASLSTKQNLKENVSVIDNHATGHEAVQFLVLNSQKTIHSKNRGYGDYIKQLSSHLSDQSI